MSATDYRVQIEIFEGPLDLLLYLVRRHELDVMDLPLADITERFLEFLDVLRFLDLDIVGDFVVTAAALLEIKSRTALPRPEEETPAEESAVEDASSDLVARLLEYKKLREASQALGEHARLWQERFPRLSDDRPGTGRDASADRIKEVELWDLVSALARVLKKKDVERQSRIQYDDTPISVYIKRIGQRVREAGRTPFSEFFEGTNRRTKIVSIFLAVLELLRHHKFRAEQPNDNGDIWILPPLEN